MTDKLVALSLGWGVQSFTLAAMAALGEIEMPDVAIHADTTHEASGTYAFAREWTPWLEARGVRVVTLSEHRREPNPVSYYGRVPLPVFSSAGDGNAPQQLNRECTNNWKRSPIRRWLQANRAGRPVEQWIGISLDEYQRMKDSDVKYIENRWPLIEKRMTRAACAIWLERHNLPIPPKSSCVFCPYHDMAAWRAMKLADGPDWQKAVEVDAAIRKARPPYDLYLHPARKPLTEIDMRNEADRGQMGLWDAECSGICGV